MPGDGALVKSGVPPGSLCSGEAAQRSEFCGLIRKDLWPAADSGDFAIMSRLSAGRRFMFCWTLFYSRRDAAGGSEIRFCEPSLLIGRWAGRISFCFIRMPPPPPHPPGGLAGNKPLMLHAGCSPVERRSTDELHYLPFLLHRLAGSPASIFSPPRGSWHHESLKLDEMKVSSYGTRHSLHGIFFFFLQIFQRVIRNHFQKRHVEPSTASDVKATYLKMHWWWTLRLDVCGVPRQ